MKQPPWSAGGDTSRQAAPPPNTTPIRGAGDYRGVRLGGRYLVERELGRGGIGVVYLARDTQLLSRPVVVKVLVGGTEKPEWVARKFQHEIAALARIDHPGVVGALDAGQTPDGKPYLVMQYVEGQTLRALLAGGPLELGRAGRLVRQVAAALAAAHARGVYHRDLKPDNVMVQGPGALDHVKLIDFGIATVRNLDHMDAGTTVTAVAGTVHYMAPEQLEGRPSAASDIYALGVIAYEVVTGKRPFEPASPFQLLMMQRKGVAVRPSELRPDLPPAAEAALLKALAFSAADRYQNVLDFGEEFARALGGQPDARHGKFAAGAHAPHHPSTSPTRIVSGARGGHGAASRARYALILVAVAALLAGAGAFGAWMSIRRDPAPENSGEAQTATDVPIDPEPAPAAERTLDYSITVQKYRGGKPYQRPFQLGAEINFERDYRIRFNVSSRQAGHLYIVNEGPAGPDGASTYVLLFPSPTANGGSPRVDAGRSVRIPGQSWFSFDGMTGMEKLWLVWSADAVPELEAVRGAANPVDRGAIRDPAPLAGMLGVFARYSAEPAEVIRDYEARRTTLRGTGDVLVHVVRLEHN